MPQIVQTLEQLLAPISDGCVLAVPRENSGVAMAATEPGWPTAARATLTCGRAARQPSRPVCRSMTSRAVPAERYRSAPACSGERSAPTRATY